MRYKLHGRSVQRGDGEFVRYDVANKLVSIIERALFEILENDEVDQIAKNIAKNALKTANDFVKIETPM